MQIFFDLRLLYEIIFGSMENAVEKSQDHGLTKILFFDDNGHAVKSLWRGLGKLHFITRRGPEFARGAKESRGTIG
jgi:hypothetical protein